MRKLHPTADVHGFRSTFADWAEDTQNFKTKYVRQCLVHKVGSATFLHYRRRKAFEKRKVILETWSQYCESGLKPTLKLIKATA
jgi:integrase